MSKHFLLIAFVTFGLLFSGCDKKAGGAGGASGDGQKVEITANDQMQFNLKEIKAKPGQKLELTLKNIGKQSKDVMGHNFVLLKKDADAPAFVKDAMAAKATDYIPEAGKGQIIAHTKLLGGGESDTITFTVPSEPGSYPFLCSFPGHYALMNGKLIVE